MADAVITELLASDGISIVDPAMADHGKLYSGFDETYANAMERLCRKADIILPNITEAAMFARMPYEKSLNEAYVRELLEKMDHPCVVMTGVAYEKGKTGIFLLEEGKAVWTYVDVVHSNISSFAITGCRRKETALEEGSIVITSGNMNLADGTSVQAVKP